MDPLYRCTFFFFQKPVTIPSSRNKVLHVPALRRDKILSNASVERMHVQSRFFYDKQPPENLFTGRRNSISNKLEDRKPVF